MVELDQKLVNTDCRTYYEYELIKMNLKISREDQLYHQNEIINILKFYITLLTGLVTLVVLINNFKVDLIRELQLFIILFLIPISLNVVHNLYLKILYKTIRNSFYMVYLENLLKSIGNHKFQQFENFVMNGNVHGFNDKNKTNTYKYSLVYNLAFFTSITVLLIAVDVFFLCNMYEIDIFRGVNREFVIVVSLLGLLSSFFTITIIIKNYIVFKRSDFNKIKINYNE